MIGFSSIIVFVSFFLSYCSGAVINFHASANPETSLSPHPILIVVSYDGFRHDYFDKTERIPWLNALKMNGVSVPYMDPVFPTVTFPNHQSIATGLYAETHGVTDNVLFDPLYNKTLSGFSDDPGFWNYSPDVLPIWVITGLYYYVLGYHNYNDLIHINLKLSISCVMKWLEMV